MRPPLLLLTAQFNLATVLAVLALVTGLTPPCMAQTQTTIEMLIEPRPPMIEMSGHRLTGEMGRIAQAILDASGLRYQLSVLSIDQQLAQITAGQKPACAVGRIYGAERAKTGVFSQSFFATTSYVAVVRKDATWAGDVAKLADWADDLNRCWGTKLGYLYEGYIARQLATAHSQRVIFPEENQDVARKLITKQFDFVLMTEGEAKLLISRDKDAAQLRLVQLMDLTGGGEPRYFYCSQNLSAQDMKKLNDAITHVLSSRPD